VSRQENLLPMGFSQGCELLVPIGIDQPITYDDVRVPGGRLVDELRREQDTKFDDV